MEALDLAAFKGRRILVTGHTGFKGAWLSLWMTQLGAEVSGVALPPEGERSLFRDLRIEGLMRSTNQDIRDRDALRRVIADADPELIVHLAAQSLVRRGYQQPVETFETNLGGTVNLLEAARSARSLHAVLVVTSDKCYAQSGGITRPFREADPLGGADPYSASKACAEIATASYRRLFSSSGPMVMTARAGNVIGGGDWSIDRIVPDAMRAAQSNTPLVVRNPDAVRPWQHVLECLQGYLLLLKSALSGDRTVADAWNFGPEPGDEIPVRDVVTALQQHVPFEWLHVADPDAVHEAQVLRLDSTKARTKLGWSPHYRVSRAIDLTAGWYGAVFDGADVRDVTMEQLRSYAG